MSVAVNIFAKLKYRALLVFLLILCSAFPVFAEMSSTNYSITSDVIGSAEGASGSTNYNLLVNMGEVGIGKHDSTNWSVKSGFLHTINSTISISVDNSSINLGSLAPSADGTGTTVVTVSTDAIGGYTLSAHRSSAGYTDTLRHTDTTTYISDKTDWDPSANGGNGNAAIWSGSGLGFTVFANDNGEKNTTWWGTGATETDANNKYAGFATAATKIVDTTDYLSGDRQTSVGYKITVPNDQKSGTYSGEVTYTAAVNL